MDEEIALRQLEELKKCSGNMRLAAEKWDSEFQTLISIILSARTLDETTIKVGTKLFEEYPDTKSLAKADIEDIKQIINSINFFENKSKYIIECSKILEKEYNGNPPHDLDKLIQLSGVGRKTANVFLSEVGSSGIGVDTHVQYISQRLGWTKNSKPEKIEDDLKMLFSKENWNKINSSLVRFGKTHTNRSVKDKILEKIKEVK
ncbi:MAG: endonuclease III [Nanoarchaeota archaeon]|nr:endonuclease III [Nanoarchaeota archaeon]